MTPSSATTIPADLDLVAVTDAPPGQCGAIVWWRLSGGLDLASLSLAWAVEGLDEKLLPAEPSKRVVLRRTAKSLAASGELVQPLGNGGLALATIVDNDEGGDVVKFDALQVTVRGAVKLDENGSLLVRGLDAGLAAQLFAEHSGKLSQEDASYWLTKMVLEVEAIPLRDTGGIYFVPRYSLARWESMLRAVRAASQHVVSSVPAMTSNEAAGAFLDAMRTAALKAAAEMAADVARLDAGEEKFGPRALRSRVSRTEELEAQISKYEEILGGKLDDVRAEIMSVRAQLTVAVTKAEQAEEAAKSAAE